MTTRADIMQALREMATAGEVRATIQAIADRAGVSKRTVIRVLRVLERRGEIQREGREREVGLIRLDGSAGPPYGESMPQRRPTLLLRRQPDVTRRSTAFTHAEVVAMGAHWLRSRFRLGAVLSDFRFNLCGEHPDVIGWSADRWSVLLECKASRADFGGDFHKPHRMLRGMGQERWYFAPAGIIGAGEVPDGWGLATFAGRGVTPVVTPPGSILGETRGVLDFAVCAAEMAIVLAAVRKVSAGEHDRLLAALGYEVQTRMAV